jgi:hypothetical protein
MSRASNISRHNQFKTATDRRGGVPQVLTGFTATQTGATTMDLVWVNPADQLAGVNVRIERSPVDADSYAVIDTVPATDEAYADTGLTTATAYFYRITAVEEISNISGGSEANDTTA